MFPTRQLPDFPLRGLHGERAADWMRDNGVRGWAVETIYAQGDLQTTRGVDFSSHAAAGVRVLVRWNYSYASTDGGGGTYPRRERYAEFADWCRRSIAASKGVWGHIIGNEPNRRGERPDLSDPITAIDVASVFNLVWNGRPAGARLSPPAIDPTNIETAEPRGYWRQILERIDGADFFAVHAYSYGSEQHPESEDRFGDFPLQWQYHSFRMWQPLADVLHDEYPRFRFVPIIITETNPLYLRGSNLSQPGWDADANYWIQRMYDFVRSWNDQPGDQYIHGACLYRFVGDAWHIDDKPGLLDALKSYGEVPKQVFHEETPMTFRLRWPTQFGRITQKFNVNETGIPDIYTRSGLPAHEGVDFVAPSGSLIFACADGVIKQINRGTYPDGKPHPYGTHIRITHNTPEGEFETVYAHLMRPRDGLKVGDNVSAGETIAIADNTGAATADHLHLTLKKKGERTIVKDAKGKNVAYPDGVIDPMPYLDPFPGDQNTAPIKPRDGLAFLVDVNVPDNTVFAAGTPFTKIWRVRNSGTSDWGTGYRLAFASDTNLASVTEVPLPSAKPGEIRDIAVNLTAPAASGIYKSTWKAKAPDGTFFGPAVYTIIKSEAPQPVAPVEDHRREQPEPEKPVAPKKPAGNSNLTFVADITIPDETLLPANGVFVKTWKIKNTGETEWGDGYRLSHLGNANFASVFTVPLPKLKPGEEGLVSIQMTAPSTPGRHKTTWQGLTPDGKRFGLELFAIIRVGKA